MQNKGNFSRIKKMQSDSMGTFGPKYWKKEICYSHIFVFRWKLFLAIVHVICHRAAGILALESIPPFSNNYYIVAYRILFFYAFTSQKSGVSKT